MNDIADTLTRVKERIRTACEREKLLPATKTVSAANARKPSRPEKHDSRK